MVYRGGLENRCGLIAHRGFESLPLRQAFVSKFYIQLLIWAVVVGGAFALLWKQGYLARLANYVGETREELRKCSWPTRDELWQSTMLIAVVMFSLGIFTIVVDFVVLKFVRSLL